MTSYKSLIPALSAQWSDVICKNIDQLADAAVRRPGDQDYINQYLDSLFAFYERVNGRSGLATRPGRRPSAGCLGGLGVGRRTSPGKFPKRAANAPPRSNRSAQA